MKQEFVAVCMILILIGIAIWAINSFIIIPRIEKQCPTLTGKVTDVREWWTGGTQRKVIWFCDGDMCSITEIHPLTNINRGDVIAITISPWNSKPDMACVATSIAIISRGPQ